MTLTITDLPAELRMTAAPRSPQGETMAVSVVTRGLSDDANSFTVPPGDPLWLRISRLGPNRALHASLDSAQWHFVRHFALGEGAAPVRVTFDQITFVPESLADLRGGD